ncbi:hypothetical protein F5Y18DRAFT_125054 [Xylariaceae sp. FL1019]|nr:hypothetical protein F5Y18DRAFT_125054 [Xylariaceae sp. FL1019]
MVSPTLWSLVSISILVAAQTEEPDTGNHPDWPRWCGKVYESGYPSFEPGGETVQPPTNGSTYLYVQFKPRYSLYLDTESKASFVVNAALSPWFGVPYTNESIEDTGGYPTDLNFEIKLIDNGELLVKGTIGVNETGREYEFSLAGLTPSKTPYGVTLSGSSADRDVQYSTTSELVYLPDNPSVTKIDHLKGSLLFKNPSTSDEFVPFLPYGYYGLYNGSNDTAASEDFVRNYTTGGAGLNSIISLAGFADTNPVYDSMDAADLRFMFDLRGSYKNLTDTEQRVNTIKNHTSLFAYWTADEPDGWQVPFDKTPAAQALIHALDPYHPVAVTLNCQDYYFGAYSEGSDILMEDVYPIGINSTFSKWGTVCNRTLGDCGCDNCEGGVQDVPSRLDDLQKYESWLGRWPLPKFHNPQVFHGEDYWARDPTPDEARAMNALAFNRGATGIFGWTWPSTNLLFDVHSQMANVVTTTPVSDFLLSGKPGRLSVAGYDLLDVAYWIAGQQMMVSVVWGVDDAIDESVSIELPVVATNLSSVVFGELSWRLDDDQLTIDQLPAMSTSFIILNV